MAYSAVVNRVAELSAEATGVEEGLHRTDRPARGHLGPADPRPGRALASRDLADTGRRR